MTTNFDLPELRPFEVTLLKHEGVEVHCSDYVLPANQILGGRKFTEHSEVASGCQGLWASGKHHTRAMAQHLSEPIAVP